MRYGMPDEALTDLDVGISERVILFYLYNLYLIEMLQKAQPNEISAQVAYQFGQEYLTVWRDDPKCVLDFFYQNKDRLIDFQCNKLHDKVRECIKNTDTLCDSSYRKIPLDPQTIRAIRNEFDTMLASLPGGIVFPRNASPIMMSNSQLGVDDILNLNRKNKSWGRNNLASSTPMAMIDSILRGTFATYMNFNKENDNPVAQNNYKNNRYEVLDNKYYKCFCHQLDDVPSYIVHLPSAALYCGICFRLYIPVGMNPDTLDRFFDKYIKTRPDYLKAVEECRKCSDMTPTQALNTENRTCCCEVGRLEKHSRGGTEPTLKPDSDVERYLILQYLRTEQTRKCA